MRPSSEGRRPSPFPPRGEVRRRAATGFRGVGGDSAGGCGGARTRGAGSSQGSRRAARRIGADREVHTAAFVPCPARRRGAGALAGAFTRTFFGAFFGHGTARAPRSGAGTRVRPHLRAVSGCRSARDADELPPGGPVDAVPGGFPPRARAFDAAGGETRGARGRLRRAALGRRSRTARSSTGSSRPAGRRGGFTALVPAGNSPRSGGVPTAVRRGRKDSANAGLERDLPAPAGPEPGRPRRRNRRTLSSLKELVPFHRRPIRILLSPLHPWRKNSRGFRSMIRGTADDEGQGNAGTRLGGVPTYGTSPERRSTSEMPGGLGRSLFRACELSDPSGRKRPPLLWVRSARGRAVAGRFRENRVWRDREGGTGTPIVRGARRRRRPPSRAARGAAPDRPAARPRPACRPSRRVGGAAPCRGGRSRTGTGTEDGRGPHEREFKPEPPDLPKRAVSWRKRSGTVMPR